ncbi:transposase tnpA [mine drainage metagenome]|uniref:Transposase tnpA n=1 Tax=mine drainage metagenome TaxID=410659 RepID=T1CBM0_9ZZZZ
MTITRARRGRRHSLRSLLACILCAVVSGATGSSEIGEWIERMTPTMLRQVRCRRNAAGEYVRPSESTVRRLLQKMPVQSLERELGGWLQAQAAAHPEGKKTVRDRPRWQNPARLP